MRGANIEEVGATHIEETKLQTPVLRIYRASVVPCPQLRPTIVACSLARTARTRLTSSSTAPQRHNGPAREQLCSSSCVSSYIHAVHGSVTWNPGPCRTRKVRGNPCPPVRVRKTSRRLITLEPARDHREHIDHDRVVACHARPGLSGRGDGAAQRRAARDDAHERRPSAAGPRTSSQL